MQHSITNIQFKENEAKKKKTEEKNYFKYVMK